jgi:hypothetical protein
MKQTPCSDASQQDCPEGEQANGWLKQGTHVLASLRRLENTCLRLADQQTEMKTRMMVMQVKVGVWGAFGAAIPTTIGVLWMLSKGGQ